MPVGVQEKSMNLNVAQKNTLNVDSMITNMLKTSAGKDYDKCSDKHPFVSMCKTRIPSRHNT